MQQFCNCHSTVTAENGDQTPYSYYCTAVWPQLNNLTYAQFNRPLGKTQSTNVRTEIGLHSYTVRNKLLTNVIELQTLSLRRAKQHVPQDYKIHTPKRNQNAKCTSAQQQSEPRNASDKRSHGPVQRYQQSNADC